MLFTFFRHLYKRDFDNECHDEDEEHARRPAEELKFDEDDYPVFGPDEEDRVLVDDFEPRLLFH
jgi:enhancer of polycomb-like protein